VSAPAGEITYDCIVVGGGPAGAAAAYFLSAAGRRVLLLEKERLPRYKTCGGGLSPRFLQEQFPFSFEPVLFTQARSLGYYYKNRAVVIPVAEGAVSMVMRDALDAHLLAHCQAEVISGTAARAVRELPDRVIVETTDGRCFSAPYLVGADGANSLTARALRLRPRRTLAAALEVEARVPPAVMARFSGQMAFLFGEIRWGYLWIFAKDDHLSVGIAALRPKPGELQQTLRRVMAGYGIDLEPAALRGHPIPIYTRRERLATARALLVGDAAGLADPLSGEGIRLAVHSGRLAAQAILRGQIGRYERDLFWQIGLRHAITGPIALLFYALQGPLFYLGTLNPFSTQGVIDLLAGRISPAGLAVRSALTLPLFGLTELTARALAALGRREWANRLRAAVYPADVSAAYRS